MRASSIQNLLSGLIIIGVLLPAVSPAAAAGAGATFQYRLSGFDGPIASLWARVAVDEPSGEVYTLNLGEGRVQIFNKTGMLLYSFGQDLNLAGSADLAAGDDGEIYIAVARATRSGVLRLDYRGRLLSFIGLGHLPVSYQPFRPTRLDYRSGKLYLLDTGSMRLVVLSSDGTYVRGYELKSLIMAQLPEDDKKARKKVSEMEIDGFCVDKTGNVYFTAPTLFSAFRLSSSGVLVGFGKQGSGPGKFGVVSGIGVAGDGRIYVADKLRCVVLIFDSDLKFHDEFGYRGNQSGNLVVPGDVAVDSRHGNIYVAQAANRGVSDFKLTGP